MTPTILITRPAPRGMEFSRDVRQILDVPVIISPLMQIGPVKADLDLSGLGALIFTSRHAVTAFAMQTDRRDLPCFAVGPATACTAREAGLDVTEAGGDANALIARIIESGCPGPFLHLRGEHISRSLIAPLARAGLTCREQIVYRQTPVTMGDAAKNLLQRENPVIVPLFSCRSAALFFSGLKAKAPIYVAAISDNVAARVPAHMVKSVVIAEAPNAEAMLALLPGLVIAAQNPRVD